ncbi:hypothetical protein SAMN05192529_13627 [Arachidicoccus rhizosphaerae]|uniref:Uncharacterized protein n=1 Tax=Arachidicoccus rhizosphaerae TaxID=551991 RepID=A0A1H4CTR1_9BACT|nr:hypothetical protein [Arachidicoccus rhizosphaerae]SEA63721.1 hypothetical protein SAMN05192529_13627 [Arachidicoccus rhizosphaerae]
MIPNNDEFKWYYNGTSYIGRQKDSDYLLEEIGSMFTNSHDFGDLSNRIHGDRFERFNKNKIDNYKYNLNDIRFWNSPIWRKLDSLASH